MFGVGIIGQVGGIGNAAVNPLSLFPYSIDFVNATTVGGFQIYGNNTNDGRFFLDPTNVTAGFVPSQSGVLSAVAASGLKRSNLGHWNYPSATNRALWNRDLTNAAWTKTNVTAAKNQTGAEGTANAASSITATANLGTVTQAITLASGQVVFSIDIKRLTGAGTLEMTVDGGSTWTSITGLTTAYQQKFITQASVTNPTIGFRIGTSGDSFAVDFAHLITPPVANINLPSQYRCTTTTATVLNSQSRPSASGTDVAPQTMILTMRGAFAFYWQGRSERATGGFVITGATGVFCNVQADGSVKFSDGPGNSSSGAGVWRTGLNQVNKVAGYVTASGAIRVACNGSVGSVGTGATLETALDHWDLTTNGAGANSIFGRTEKFSVGPNIAFSAADLQAMTT